MTFGGLSFSSGMGQKPPSPERVVKDRQAGEELAGLNVQRTEFCR